MSQAETTRGIVVGVDGSAESDAAVAWATHEAAMRNLPLTLLHVVTPLETGWPPDPRSDGMPSWQADAARGSSNGPAVLSNPAGPRHPGCTPRLPTPRSSPR